MASTRKQIVHLYNAVVYYLTHNHIQGEELEVLEGLRDEMHEHLREMDAMPAVPVPDDAGADTDADDTKKKKGKK